MLIVALSTCEILQDNIGLLVLLFFVVVGGFIFIFQLEGKRAEKRVMIIREQNSKVYEERKIAVGTIKCTQCDWTGQWGTGMSSDQFSANGDVYRCPVCKSDRWVKV